MKNPREDKIMAAVKELLRAEADGTLSFGDYTLESKTNWKASSIRGTFTRLRHLQRLQIRAERHVCI